MKKSKVNIMKSLKFKKICLIVPSVVRLGWI